MDDKRAGTKMRGDEAGKGVVERERDRDAMVIKGGNITFPLRKRGTIPSERGIGWSWLIATMLTLSDMSTEDKKKGDLKIDKKILPSPPFPKEGMKRERRDCFALLAMTNKTGSRQDAAPAI